MSLNLHTLPSSGRAAKRVGRGPGSGSGKTAGRGTKGQKSRAGHHAMPVHFEGGQMPLTQRLPKLRGFRNPRSADWATVTVAQLARLDATTVSLDTLQQAKLVPRAAHRVKIVGNTKPAKKFSLHVDRVSAGAKKVIEAAGGRVTLPKAEAEKPAEQAKTPQAP